MFNLNAISDIERLQKQNAELHRQKDAKKKRELAKKTKAQAKKKSR